jgi:hypothetical protein
MDVTYRMAKPSDVPFILDSWMKSWRTSPWAGTIRNDMYYEVQRSTIEGLIARGADFLLVTPASREDHILGWICYEHMDDMDVVHYIYVKDPYVKHGYQHQLLGRTKRPTCPNRAYTHAFRQVTQVCTKDVCWRHIPEIARRKSGSRRENLPSGLLEAGQAA